MKLDYSAAGGSVRENLKQTHREMLDYFAQPGPWFTGAERLTLAAESRNGADCALCRERKAALSPEQGSGEHERATQLPPALVEMAHRIRTDPQRLSRGWFERMLEAGLSEGQYVEAVGIIAFTAGLDSFCRALGIPDFPLPPPTPGEPTGYRPEGLREGIAWVAMLAPEDVSGPEAELYDGADFVPNIARALSQVPDHTRELQRESRTHYLAMKDLGNPTLGLDLDRMQMELVAARVSALNECFY